MKTNRLIAAGLLLTLVVAIGARTADAIPVTFTDVYTQSLKMGSYNTQVTFTHDIKDDGFNPATDILDSAVIEVALANDGDPFNVFHEQVSLNLVGSNQGTFTLDTGGLGFSISVALLQSQGEVVVTLTRTWGDFWFRGSILTAQGYRPDSSPEVETIPAPGALVLLASGLASVSAFMLRKRQ